MKIKKIEFRNIGPYGNKLQTLEFDTKGKLILLQGRSGDGKSTLLNLPALLLYGKLSKRSKKEIANRVNRNGFIRGEIEEGGHLYVIERKFSPNGVKVFRDGEDLDRIGIKDAQDYIDENIVGMPQEIFSNIVSLSMSKFKSFLNMSAEDRRQIIDRVFNLESVNTVLSLVRKDIRDVGAAINGDNGQIFSLQTAINQANAELNRLMEIESRKSESKDAEVAESTRIIEEQTKVAEEAAAAYNGCIEAHKKIQAKMQEAVGEAQKAYAEYSELQRMLSLYDQGRCPTCGASFEGEAFDKLRAELTSKMNAAATAYRERDALRQEAADALNKVAGIMQQHLRKSSDAQSAIASARARLGAINESKQQNVEFSSIQNIIAQNTEALGKAKAQLVEDSAKMDKLNILAGLYSTEGVKRYILKDYLPHLNAEINTSLYEMEFPFRLTFNEDFEGKLSYLSSDVGADTISDGEHKRVDLAVLCSIFKLLKRKYPSINIFTLDEVLSSLDPLTASMILRYLKTFAEQMQLNIYVVSHVEMEESLFDESIRVFKEMGFSDISFSGKNVTES